MQDYHHGKVEILSKYIGSEKPIDIVYHCPDHGDTFKTLNAKNICKPYFLPCKKCQSIRKSNSAKGAQKPNKEFYYNRLVDYCKSRGSKVLETEWTTAKSLYHFKCGNPNHPVFTTTADALYSGNHWCPYCYGRVGDFQKELEELCHNHDGELMSEYVNAGEYVRVKCNKHNYIWNVLPGNIKKGRWCPICNMGFNEKTVYDYLINSQCNFDIQYTFDDLIGNNNEKLRFDFAILNGKGQLVYLIEVDDREHKSKHFSNTTRQLQRKEAIQRDKIKDEYCKTHNIPLYRMEVPFDGKNKWSYEDYYRYINSELKIFVNLARNGENKC